MPIRAVPASPMIVRTSAKSTLMSPGLTVGKNERMKERRRERKGNSESTQKLKIWTRPKYF